MQCVGRKAFDTATLRSSYAHSTPHSNQAYFPHVYSTVLMILSYSLTFSNAGSRKLEIFEAVALMETIISYY